MSADANIQHTQYKAQMVNRAASVNETTYVDRGDIDRKSTPPVIWRGLHLASMALMQSWAGGWGLPKLLRAEMQRSLEK
jgi:hypothetical protein